MSERLPYEEQLPQQLRDFPLPDENTAWDDMKRRLEEDDDDGIIFWWRKGCAVWGLLLLVLLTIGWWVLRDNGRKEEKNSIVNVVPSGKDSIGDRPDDRTDHKQQQGIDSAYTQQKDTINHPATDSADEQTILEGDKYSSKNISRAAVPLSPMKKKKKQERTVKIETTASDTNTLKPGKKIPEQTARPPERSTTQQRDTDSAVAQRAKTFLTGDSATVPTRDSSNKTDKPDTTTDTKKKNDSLQKKEIFFSAGLALTQQIPVAGQKAVPYSAQGRKFSLADYIPSVYFRLNKKDRWFIQGEFRYGAPQYTKPLIYSEQTDTLTPTFQVTTTKQLQKTYYHQLPFSFNYYVLPEWSLGAGLVWNKFSKSVYEETVFNSNPSSPLDTAYSKETLTSKQPGELSKTYFQALLETQYQWRRVSLGARYTFGLQPYIKFTLPGQAEQKERNQSLQVFLRYELLRAPKKK